MKFLTLTFPDNVFVGPAPKDHVPGPNEIRWETPNDCREWFRTWTKKLRHFIGPYKIGKKQPSAPPEWGVRGYLAVWEVTAEKVCGDCKLGRGKHVRDPKTGKPGRGVAGGRDRQGNLIRANDCAGWRNEVRSGRFHPHLHLLVWSRFIEIAQLRERWKAVGGGGQIHLEAAKGADAVDYILKYLGKPWAGVPDDLQVVGLYRMRRVTSCGMFYGQTFTDLTASVLEPCEKTRTGIYCPNCRPGPDDGGRAAIEAVQEPPEGFDTRWSFDMKDGAVSSWAEISKMRSPLGAWTPGGVEIADLRKAGKPEKRATEWRTVKLRLIPDIPDSVELEPARFAVFAWNGVVLDILSKKLSGKVFAMPPETLTAIAALEAGRDPGRRGDDVPF